MPSENPVPENNPAPDPGGKSNKQSGHPEPKVPPAFAKSDLPPTYAHCQTCKTEKNWWDKVKPVLEIAGIGLLAVYTAYTIRMYRANKQSADAATQAALERDPGKVAAAIGRLARRLAAVRVP